MQQKTKAELNLFYFLFFSFLTYKYDYSTYLGYQKRFSIGMVYGNNFLTLI